MKKSFIFGAALMLMGALSFQSCTKADNPSVPREPAVAVFDNGMELADAIAQFAKDGVLSLPEGIELTMNKEIKLTEPLMIVGNEKKPALITANVGFNSTSDLILSNMIIDASELKTSLIKYEKVDGKKAMKSETEESAYTILNNITLNGVIVNGLKQSLIESTAGKILFKNIAVINSGVEISGNKNFFALGGGFPENLLIENSTLWSGTSHTGFFFKADGKPADVTSTTTTTWTVNQSTLINIAVGKKANNSNGGIKGKKTTIMNLKNSILYNFGSNKGNEVNGWLWGQNGGAISNYENNTYWSADGAVAGWTDSSKGGSDQTGTALATDPAFKDIKNAIFTPTGADQVDKKTGDPHWYNAN